MAAPQSGSAAEASIEYAVKANLLYKFGEYISWPAEALGPPGAPATLCIVGDNPFGETLDKAVSGERIGEHPAEVKRLDAAAAETLCHILFTRGSAHQSIAEALRAVAGHPMLTITEAFNFGAGGGVINFVVRDNRVRFEIDQQAAAVNRLEISSKLLGLAVAVKPAGRSAP